MQRIICFDLWNTLISSLDPHGASYETILINAGVSQTDIYPVVREYLMNKDWTYKEMGEFLCQHFGITNYKVGQKVVDSWKEDNDKSDWFKGAKKMLVELAKSDILILISNITGPGWRTVEQRLQISRLFEMTILSFQAGMSKPNPKLWTKIEQLYPDADEYWMIGDNEPDDLAVPCQMGWKTILVNKSGTDLAKVRSTLVQE